MPANELPKSDAEQVDSLLDQTPASVPGLDIRIDDFELRGRKLGRVEIEAFNRGEREWQLARLLLSVPEAQLTATGRWAAAPGPARRGAPSARRAQIDFQLDTGDAGALLARLGTPGAVAGGKGRVQGQIGWLGSPLAPDPATMSGQFAIGLDAGRFLKADPGAARLLSVLSLQSLPRRLSLDFRDVFGQGFAFDNVAGDIAVADGVASSANLRMRGAQAAVLMSGRADLAQETQDLSVVVVPEINAGAASLAFAAVNPALGLATFLAQLVLRQPLMSAGTREFHVSGSWAEPKVERVQRAAAGAGTAPAAPVSPAGTAVETR